MQVEFTLKIDHKCHYPFNPANIASIFLFLKKAVDYITSGEKRCAWHFAKKLEESIRSSYLLPEYYQEKFLESIREAKKRFVF